MKRTQLLVVFAFVFLQAGCHRQEEKDEKVVTEVAVETARISRVTLHAVIEVFGTVEPEPASDDKPAASARVATTVAGVLAEARAVEGRRVEKGALLFALDDRLAKAAGEKARQGFGKASEAEKFAELSLKREQTLFKQENTSQKRLQEAEQQLASAKADSASARADLAAAETQLKLLRIEAPLAGTIMRVNVKPGESVDLTAVLAEMVDLGRLVISASVPAAEAGALKPGQSLEVSGDKPVQAALTFISPQVDTKTDTVLVRAAVPVGAELRPGQFLRVRIVTEERRDRLAVPVESVVKANDATVIAIVESGVAKQVPVKVGLRDGGLVEVEGEGLKEGMTVVTKGAYGLPKETKVQLIGK